MTFPSRPSSSPTGERRHIGQLLAQLTRLFQVDLFERLVAAGLTAARVPPTPVTPSIQAAGSRLTDLADQARLTLPAMSEIVNDLERLGIVERRPDPTDGRAKLICLTDAGWDAMRTARTIIRDIETSYARIVGTDDFEHAAQTLETLLSTVSQSGRTGPSGG